MVSIISISKVTDIFILLHEIGKYLHKEHIFVVTTQIIKNKATYNLINNMRDT